MAWPIVADALPTRRPRTLLLAPLGPTEELWELKRVSRANYGGLVRAGEMSGEYGILAASTLAEVDHHGLFSKSLGHQGIV